ncbi:MAG: dipeptide epimerase [Pseudomonadota bacterium]
MTHEALSFSVEETIWPMTSPFVISNYQWTEMSVVTVSLRRGSAIGRGEGAPLFYKNETALALADALRAQAPILERGFTHKDIEDLPVPSGARNALDCALWDLTAKENDVSAWRAAGLETLNALPALATITLDDPNAMAAQAKSFKDIPILKLKLDAHDIEARTAAVRNARPDAILVIDANCAWTIEALKTHAPPLTALGVQMIEQPLPPEQDDALIGYDCPITLCADESCQTTASLPALIGKYQMINIKLDKAGGLTPSFALAKKASSMGFDIMVGNMLGSSLAMAPAFLIGQLSRYSDLDGPLSLVKDCPHGLKFHNGRVEPPTAALWG